MLDLGCGVTVADADVRLEFIRTGGPGGQNVNKVSTGCRLFFDAAHAAGLPDGLRRRLLELAGARLTREGVIVIAAVRHRTQEMNRLDALRRLRALVAEAAAPPAPPRRATRPSRGSVRRRLDGKTRRAGVKAGRGRPAGED
jgi:ribosome-associated protein